MYALKIKRDGQVRVEIFFIKNNFAYLQTTKNLL